jgi:hypothetical protein
VTELCKLMRSLQISSRTLEPVVGNAPTVSRQVIKCVQSVEVVNGNLPYSFGFRKAQVDGNPATPLLIRLLSTPEGHASADRTEVKLEGLAPDI